MAVEQLSFFDDEEEPTSIGGGFTSQEAVVEEPVLGEAPATSAPVAPPREPTAAELLREAQQASTRERAVQQILTGVARAAAGFAGTAPDEQFDRNAQAALAEADRPVAELLQRLRARRREEVEAGPRAQSAFQAALTDPNSQASANVRAVTQQRMLTAGIAPENVATLDGMSGAEIQRVLPQIDAEAAQVRRENERLSEREAANLAFERRRQLQAERSLLQTEAAVQREEAKQAAKVQAKRVGEKRRRDPQLATIGASDLSKEERKELKDLRNAVKKSGITGLVGPLKRITALLDKAEKDGTVPPSGLALSDEGIRTLTGKKREFAQQYRLVVQQFLKVLSGATVSEQEREFTEKNLGGGVRFDGPAAVRDGIRAAQDLVKSELQLAASGASDRVYSAFLNGFGRDVGTRGRELFGLEKDKKREEAAAKDAVPTAVNPKTGERLELRDGKWVPVGR